MENLALLIVSFVLLALSVVALISYIWPKVTCREEVTATVIGVQTYTRQYRSRKIDESVPTIVYRYGDEEFTVDLYRKLAKPLTCALGDVLTIRVDPKNPKHFEVEKHTDMLATGLVGIVVAAILFYSSLL